MKDFRTFLEEVTIKGNPGIPGEGEKQAGESDYLRDLERSAKTRLGIRGGEFPFGMQRLGQRIMELVDNSQRMCRGKERELEQLAYDIIVSNYGDILEGVELDIKFGGPDEIVENMEECDGDCPPTPEYDDIEDEDLIKRIHKAKLSNNIIQGEAKNTKHIIHSEEVKDGLKEIFDNDWQEIFDIWDEISKIADKMDWIIPINVKSRMMEEQPQGMAGSVNVSWQPKEYKPKEVKDFTPGEDQVQNEPEEESYVPVIKARGIDFPMLIHESVKGIYELIASISQPTEGASPDEIRQAQTVKMNVSSFDDEVEDFRTGPEIAADLRDFINQNPDSRYSKNMREFVFGKMMDEEYMTPDEFLKLFRGILNKSDEARSKVDSMISEIIKELKDYELGGVVDMSEDPYVSDVEKMVGGEEEPDYSEMSQKEIRDLVDDALDDGDFEKVKKLTQYMKEGKEIYLREIERINENHSYSRRK